MRLFHEGFSVMDIAEPLASFDAEQTSDVVRAFMEEKGYQLVGVRTGGLVTGYVRLEELDGGVCGDHMHPFGEHDTVPDTASLAEAIESLGINGRCFVTILDKVAGIITMGDLEKPPVRMYLFGMITIAEVLLVRAIEGHFPDEQWTRYVTPTRLHKARDLQAERSRRKQPAKLIDCLQFSDKAGILIRSDRYEFLGQEGGPASKKEAKRAIKELETLRNHLAHTQQIVASSWDRIVVFSSRLERLLQML